jgi:hypothetical protein
LPREHIAFDLSAILPTRIKPRRQSARKFQQIEKASPRLGAITPSESNISLTQFRHSSLTMP